MIPKSIHIDANMHPWLYENLHLFPFVFDEVSVWGFAPRLHSLYNTALPLADLSRLLISDCPPFVLSCASDYYTQERRATLPSFFSWHEFDDRVATQLIPQRKVMQFAGPAVMRQRAWDLADRLTDEAERYFGEEIFEADPASLSQGGLPFPHGAVLGRCGP